MHVQRIYTYYKSVVPTISTYPYVRRMYRVSYCVSQGSNDQKWGVTARDRQMSNGRGVRCTAVLSTLIPSSYLLRIIISKDRSRCFRPKLSSRHTIHDEPTAVAPHLWQRRRSPSSATTECLSYVFITYHTTRGRATAGYVSWVPGIYQVPGTWYQVYIYQSSIFQIWASSSIASNQGKT